MSWVADRRKIVILIHLLRKNGDLFLRNQLVKGVPNCLQMFQCNSSRLGWSDPNCVFVDSR